MTTETTNTQSAAELSESTLAMLRKLYDRSKAGHSHLNSPEARAAAEQEAAQAAEMLGRLLDKYGLALADVDSKGHSTQISAGHVGERTIDFGKSNFAWKIALARSVARHNNVTILKELYHRNKISGFVLVGLALHVEATMMLLEWLFAQIKALASADYQAYKADPDNKWHHIDPLRWHTNYGKGAAERLDTRLIEVRDIQKAQEAAQAREASGEGPVVSLAINIGTAVRDYLEAKEPHRKEARLREERYQARIAQDRAIREIQPRAWQVWLEWQAPWVQLITLHNLTTQLEAKKEADDKWWKEYQAEQAKKRARRERYEDRFYDRHGYYPGEGRRQRQEVDNTEWTAYNQGHERADSLNLSPHLGPGEEKGTPGALPR